MAKKAKTLKSAEKQYEGSAEDKKKDKAGAKKLLAKKKGK